MACDYVLVVDDDDDIRESLKLVLEDEGFAVETAANGQLALEQATASTPCVILLDLMMPVMDGVEFLRLRQRDERLARVPVVVISAFNPQALPGAPECLSKPVNLSRLIQLTQRLCSEQRAAAPPKTGSSAQEQEPPV